MEIEELLEMEQETIRTVFMRILEERRNLGEKRLDNSNFCELITTFTELSRSIVEHMCMLKGDVENEQRI